MTTRGKSSGTDKRMTSARRRRRRAKPSTGSKGVPQNCRNEVALLADYVAGRLRPAALSAFLEHLAQCPDCEAFLNTYKKTLELTRSFLSSTGASSLARPLQLRPRS